MHKVFVKNPDIVFRKIAGECILVPIKHRAADLSSIYTLNEVGDRIWELIDGKRRLQEIRDIIVEDFEVNPQEAEKDLKEFLHQLEDSGVIKAV